jgi:hypothetical protein
MRSIPRVLPVLAVLLGVLLGGVAARSADEPPPEASPPPASFTVEACDIEQNRCMLACEKENPGIAGDMLCTGCGFNCYTDHKACLARAWYRKLFGPPGGR